VISISLIVPAAGKGSRMGSDIPKCLVTARFQSLLSYSTFNLKQHCIESVLIHSPGVLSLFEYESRVCGFKSPVFIEQSLPKGNAQAVLLGLENSKGEYAFIVWGDHVGARNFPAEKVIAIAKSSRVDFILPLVERDNPYVYFSFNEGQQIMHFSETSKGAPRLERGFSDTGVFFVKRDIFCRALQNWIQEQSHDQDLNFLAFFASQCAQTLQHAILFLEDISLTEGVNSPSELSRFEMNLLSQIVEDEETP